MVEFTPEGYDGQRENFDYVEYTGSYWRMERRQIMRRTRLQRWGTFLKGVPEEIKYLLGLSIGSSWKEIVLPDLVRAQTEQHYDGLFLINGRNETSVIRNLNSLTGLPIAELERRMRPDNRNWKDLKPKEYYGSNSDFGGFIKPGESLLEVMARDNDYVLGQGVTHQEVARPMLQISNAWSIFSGNHYLHFRLNGNEYLLGSRGFPMSQDSPFNDGIDASGFNISIQNLKTGEKFFYAPLTAILIHRYGFYEGDVMYRVDPKKAMDFFHKTN